MQEYIIYLISTLITLPLIASFLIYIISMIIERHKWKAIHRAVSWSTAFYIISVSIMLNVIYGNHFIGFIIILLIAISAIIIFIQWKKKQDVDIRKAFKLMWRVTFLLFFVLYWILIIAGIIIQLVE